MSNDHDRKAFYRHLYALDADAKIEIWRNGEGQWVARGNATFPAEVSREIAALLDRLNALSRP